MKITAHVERRAEESKHEGLADQLPARFDSSAFAATLSANGVISLSIGLMSSFSGVRILSAARGLPALGMFNGSHRPHDATSFHRGIQQSGGARHRAPLARLPDAP